MRFTNIVKYTVTTIAVLVIAFVSFNLAVKLTATAARLYLKITTEEQNDGKFTPVQTTETSTAAPAKQEKKEVAKPAGTVLSSLSVSPHLVSSGVVPSKSFPVLVFGKKNTVVFRDVVTNASVGTLQKQLIDLSNALPPEQPIYLVLETPGGSVDAGKALVDTVMGLPQEVKTVTFFAASMGFHMVESLGERLIVPSGVLMSHRVRISGLEGQVPGEAVTRLNQILRQSQEMDVLASKRIGMNLKDYQDLIRDEYWVSGVDAVSEGMADKVILPRCGADLTGSYTQNIMTLFGPVQVTWSECPLISAPLEVNMSGIVDQEERDQVQKFINSYLVNKRSFTLKYIVNREYTKVLAE